METDIQGEVPVSKHCETCICGRRAPVQADNGAHLPADHPHRPDGAMPRGTIAWSEHVEAYGHYSAKHGRSQSAERIAERGGFSYRELVSLLGHTPTTWKPAR